MYIQWALVSLAFTSLVRAQQNCNATSLCGTRNPCCSEFGFCGDDDYCLGGCNPLSSKAVDSCRPRPICKDATYTFADNSRILSNSTKFEGNASEYDWVVDKGNIMNNNGELVMLLTKENGGTRLSSTRYVHYGKITAKLKTGRWAGIVTAFITMSDIKDEIDWEFPGTTVTEGQSNFFWQGVIPPKTDGETHKGISDTYANYHDYTIDWQPDSLTFSIDDKVVRTIKKEEGRYPTTPARVQLSLWPAGIDGAAKGTVEWAGGMIDYNNADYKSAGHFYASVKSISIKCSDPTKPGPDITSYIYGTGASAKNPTVQFSNKSTLIDGASVLGIDSRLKGALVLVAGLIFSSHFFI